MRSDLVTVFLRWALARAALARGWWLCTALRLVVAADLSPVELILLGVFQGLTVIVAEVPAGVLADVVSRRGALVVGHVVMGVGMAMAGVVTGFPLLVVSQCLWGLGWALSSGADVAWISDELDRPDVIDRVLTAQARRELLGAPIGIVGFGVLASATTLSTAIVAAGVAMVALGAGTVSRWPETRFRPIEVGRRWAGSTAIMRRGAALAGSDRVIGRVLVATLLVTGSAVGFGRLFERTLLQLGVPTAPDPIVWFAAIGLVASALGATTLSLVEARIDGVGVARRAYATACAVAAVGLVVFAHAPSAAAAVAGSVFASGLGFPTIRLAGTILVNRRVTSDVRATVHSLLSQSENLGEVVVGVALACLAGSTSATVALMGSAVLLGLAGVVVARSR